MKVVGFYTKEPIPRLGAHIEVPPSRRIVRSLQSFVGDWLEVPNSQPDVQIARRFQKKQKNQVLNGVTCPFCDSAVVYPNNFKAYAYHVSMLVSGINWPCCGKSLLKVRVSYPRRSKWTNQRYAWLLSSTESERL